MWHERMGFPGESHICAADGIVCNEAGNIVQLTVNNNTIKGKIPVSLGSERTHTIFSVILPPSLSRCVI